MGGKENRTAVVANLSHNTLKQVGGFRIKSHKGFIHKYELGFVYQSRNDGKLLLHSVGIGGNGHGKTVGQLKGVGIFCYAFVSFPAADTENIGDEIQKFNTGHIFVNVGIVRDIGHLFFTSERICFYGFSVDKNFSAVKRENSRNSLKRGGLAGAVVSDKSVYFSRGDVN